MTISVSIFRLGFARLLTCALLVAALAGAPPLAAESEARLLRFPAIHSDFVVFVYAGDLWRAPSAGGRAHRLTSHAGVELTPKVSPDGEWIAYSAAVLTGRLQIRQSTIIIRAELVDVTDGTSLWGGLLKRPAGDLLEIEDEICQEIADNLRFELSPEEKSRIAKRHTKVAEGHKAYLQGRFV